MKRYLPGLFLLIALAVLLQPWRPIAGQDDAAYAIFADRIAHGSWAAPNLLALAYPQGVLGGWLASIFTVVPSLSIYMLLAFLAYALNLFLTFRFSNSWLLTFALFLFPVTLQYGLGFLSEMFVLSFGLLYLLALKSWIDRRSVVAGLSIVVLSALIMAQRQTMMILPLGALAYLAPCRDRKLVMPLVLGIMCALIIDVALPKTYLQQRIVGFLTQHWAQNPHAALDLLSRFFQYTFAAGLFFFPFAFCYTWTRRDFGFACALLVSGTALFASAQVDPISAGVLFTNYFPRILSALFLGFGAFGLIPFFDRLARLPRVELAMVLLCWIAFCLFTTFTDAGDIKYVLPLALCLAALMSGLFEIRRILIGYVLIVGLFSVVVNRYYLDTVEKRWAVAAELESRGTDPRLISAGYGRDYYRLAEGCVEKAVSRIDRSPMEHRRDLSMAHLFDVITRYQEDGAVFQFLVKPDLIMGRRLSLRRNTLAGQNGVPVSTYEYRVFGIPNSLAVYENSKPVLPWCDQAEVKE